MPGGATATPVDAKVFHVRIDEHVACGNLEGLLSPDERDRAQAFEVAIDRTRYVVAHALLRRTLESAIGCAGLRFHRNPFGKPLLEPIAGRQWHFSLSHNRSLAVCAVSDRHEVGIDAESRETAGDLPGLARRYFSRSESDWLARRDPAIQAASFYRLWTCKEAVIKALGRGLSFALDAFSVSLDREPPALQFDAGSEGAENGWALRTRTLAGNEVALAIRAATALQHPPSVEWRELTVADLERGLCPGPPPD